MEFGGKNKRQPGFHKFNTFLTNIVSELNTRIS